MLLVITKMKTESKVGTLAMKLARQSFLGDDVMGVREYPVLNLDKRFNLFPRNASEFEEPAQNL